MNELIKRYASDPESVGAAVIALAGIVWALLNALSKFSFIGPALGRLGRWCWRSISGSARIREVDDRLVHVEILANEIAEQLRTNSGSSTRDRVNSIERIVTEISEEQRIVTAALGITGAVANYAHAWSRVVHERVPAFETDADGRNVWVSRAYLDVTGYMQEDVMGSSWQTIIHPDDKDRVLSHLQHCLETQSRYVIRHRIILEDSRAKQRQIDHISVEVHAAPVFVGEKMTGCVGVFRETGAQKTRERTNHSEG